MKGIRGCLRSKHSAVHFNQRLLVKINAFLRTTSCGEFVTLRAKDDPNIRCCLESKSVSLPLLKRYISIPEVNSVIVGLLKDSALLASILRDERISAYYRYCLVERYSLFVRMLYDPDSVEGWVVSQ